LKQDADFKAVYLERAGDGPPMVKDAVVAALWAAAPAGRVHRHDVRPAGARFIAPSEEEIAPSRRSTISSSA